VRSYLFGRDFFLLQNANGRVTRGLTENSRDINAYLGHAKVAVRFRESGQAIVTKHRAYSRRIVSRHLVDANEQSDLKFLFDSQPSKESVLGTAGASAFAYHDQRIVDVGIAAVGKFAYVSCSGSVAACDDG